MKRQTIIALTIVVAIAMGAFAAEKKLSKSEVREIVEQYEAAVRKSEPKPPPHLYYDTSPEALHERHRRSGGVYRYGRVYLIDAKDVDRITVKKVEGQNVLIKISYRDRLVPAIGGGKDQITPANKEGYLQFTPDGKIKYDSIFLIHPVEKASYFLQGLAYNYSGIIDLHDKKKPSDGEQSTLKMHRRAASGHIEELSTVGVPLFGLSAEKPLIEQRESLLKLAKWLSKEAVTWDVSEPIIPLPEDRFKAISKKAKRMRLEKP